MRFNGTDEQLLDLEYMEAQAALVEDKIEKSGRTVSSVRVPEPGEVGLQNLFDSISLLLTPLGLIALMLSGFLVINTISALMAQQTRQIGVMKSIGGQTITDHRHVSRALCFPIVSWHWWLPFR